MLDLDDVDVHTGDPEAAPEDWRAAADDDDDDPDDEEMSATPADVVAALGFDPLEPE